MEAEQTMMHGEIVEMYMSMQQFIESLGGMKLSIVLNGRGCVGGVVPIEEKKDTSWVFCGSIALV